MENLQGKKVLITGAGKRIGSQFALSAAKAGASIIIHHGHSAQAAEQLREQILSIGADAQVFQADFSEPEKSLEEFKQLFSKEKDIYALVNNASLFEALSFKDTTLESWNRHMNINLTMPFLLSQAFAHSLDGRKGRIINILDWRALRPGKDHFPYTISKAALAAMTRSLAVILAPNIIVNGLALGAILPPSDGSTPSSAAGTEDAIIKNVPAGRWADMQDLTEAFIFLLSGPEYITGEIIHLDGGRHLV